MPRCRKCNTVMRIRNPSYLYGMHAAFVNCKNCRQGYYILVPEYIPTEQIEKYIDKKSIPVFVVAEKTHGKNKLTWKSKHSV